MSSHAPAKPPGVYRIVVLGDVMVEDITFSTEPTGSSRPSGRSGPGAANRNTPVLLRRFLVAPWSTTDVGIEVWGDGFLGVPAYEGWWDVPVAEVSDAPAVQEARRQYEQAREAQRQYLDTP